MISNSVTIALRDDGVVYYWHYDTLGCKTDVGTELRGPFPTLQHAFVEISTDPEAYSGHDINTAATGKGGTPRGRNRKVA